MKLFPEMVVRIRCNLCPASVILIPCKFARRAERIGWAVSSEYGWICPKCRT